MNLVLRSAKSFLLFWEASAGSDSTRGSAVRQPHHIGSKDAAGRHSAQRVLCSVESSARAPNGKKRLKLRIETQQIDSVMQIVGRTTASSALLHFLAPALLWSQQFSNSGTGLPIEPNRESFGARPLKND
jgi:hypothetical protein